jgi:hypothetical protein
MQNTVPNFEEKTCYEINVQTEYINELHDLRRDCVLISRNSDFSVEKYTWKNGKGTEG